MEGDGRSSSRSIGRTLVTLSGVVAVAVLGWLLFVVRPDSTAELLGTVLVVVLVPVGARIGGSVASTLLPSYNVAEVAVEGPIQRSAGSTVPAGPVGSDADDLVEQIERADADGNVDALLVKLDTPGGEIVPSEDVRLAVERFDGPTVAYATDVCASGGYDIASGCDELWAREGSIVGSIGVIGSRINAKDLADRLGLRYEQFTAGEYKDAGLPLKELTEDEREYLQGIVDDYYEQFVETVAEGRGMDPGTVRDTEARIYLGEEANERGLVDEIGTRRDVRDRLEERLGEPVGIEEFVPEQGVAERLQVGTQRVAFALGAGIADAADGDLAGLRFRE